MPWRSGAYSPVPVRPVVPRDEALPGCSGFRTQLYVIIFEADTPSGKAFDIVLLVAILISVLLVILESVPHLNHRYSLGFRLSEYMFTSAFGVEYVIRLMVAPSAGKYACSFFGLVDAASILPTFLELLLPGANSLRVVRVLRLLRVFQVLHMSGFINDAKELTNAFYAARRKILLFLSVVMVLVTVIGTLMYLVEDSKAGFTSIPASIYWTIVTITTVGYGDIAPTTLLGQCIASLMMVLGYAIIAVPTGLLGVSYGAEIAARELRGVATREGRMGGGGCSETAALSCAMEDADANFCKHCGAPLRRC